MKPLTMTLLALLAVTGVAPAVPSDDADPSKRDDALIQGTWIVTAMNVKGEVVPDEKLEKERAFFRFRMGTMSTKAVHGDGTWRDGAYRLDASKRPGRLTMKGGEGEETAIYDIKDDTLRIAFRSGPREEAEKAGPPAGFEPKPDVWILTLKRVKE